jgi:hypothetical protein
MDSLEEKPVKIPLVLFTVLSLVFMASCSSSTLEDHKTGKISSSQTLGIRNGTVIRVDPNDREVHVDWKGFNVETGDALHVPYEEIRLSAGAEQYLVSSRGVGNNQLVVNERLHDVNGQSEQLLIRFGAGVSVEQGGDYRRALKQYDVDFSQLQERTEPAAAPDTEEPRW